MDFEKQKLEEKMITDQNQNTWSSNPLSGSGKIAKMNAIAPARAVSNRLFAGYNQYLQKI